MTFWMPDSMSCSASSVTARCVRHVPHPAEPAPRLAGQPHAHLARRLGHIDRGDPLDHQLVFGVGNSTGPATIAAGFCLCLRRAPTSLALQSNPSHYIGWTARGPRSREPKF